MQLFQRTKRVLAPNKMDRHSCNVYFVDLLRQLNEALEKCNFVRSICEIWGTSPHEELNEEDMSAREISYKYKQWCMRNHPDKQKDDREEENKEAATALIKEFGLILQKPSEVSKFSTAFATTVISF